MRPTLAAASLFLVGIACGEKVDPELAEPAVTDVEGARLERMYAVRGPDRKIHAGGYPGSARPLMPIELRLNGQVLGSTVADQSGRFRLVVDSDAAAIELVLPEASISFRVRDAESGRSSAPRSRWSGLGNVPNDVAALPDGTLAVARSGDNAVGVISPSGELQLGVRLPSVEEGGRELRANPWFVAALDEQRVVTTAYGQRRVFIVDLSSRAIESTLDLADEVVLPSAFKLTRPFDVDENGTLETEVTRFVPKGPQGTAISGHELFATFTSVVSASEGTELPVVLPGVLARWNLEAPATPPETLVLPALDPQEVRVSPRSTLWVVCSGALARSGGPTRAISPGALVEVDPSTMQVLRSVPLGDFGPSSAIERSDGMLWVSSLVRGRVGLFHPDESAPRQVVAVSEEEVDSVFRLTPFFDGLAFVPSFDTDRLHVLDLTTGELNPPPFFAPLVLGPGLPIISGLQVVALRPGRPGVDFVGPDAFALLGLASQVVPIELRKLFGP
ncbi:MAG: hypothetical protein HY791_36395 [Deltaproteobacteria bacterium]|nr:hypothetical protein [Deltaproteobacteria bacterium]